MSSLYAYIFTFEYIVVLTNIFSCDFSIFKNYIVRAPAAPLKFRNQTDSLLSKRLFKTLLN